MISSILAVLTGIACYLLSDSWRQAAIYLLFYYAGLGVMLAIKNGY